MAPLYVGGIPFGLAYAVTARGAGLELFDPQLMSAAVFAGSRGLAATLAALVIWRSRKSVAGDPDGDGGPPAATAPVVAPGAYWGVVSHRYHLAQFNIARLLAPLDDPRLADFVADLERINAAADAHPGFVWRLQDDDGDATSYRPFGDRTLVNMSVWETIDDLFAYTYRSAHLEPLRRRREWFAPLEGPHLVLWWVPTGHRPTLAEAGERLERLRRHGATPAAFTFRERFEPPAA